MQHITSSSPAFTATGPQASLDCARASDLAMSALQTTREAIARWTGGVLPAEALPRDLARISPQARWVSQAQRGLAMWKECGGFSQTEQPMCSTAMPPLPTPLMLDISALPDTNTEHIDACMD